MILVVGRILLVREHDHARRGEPRDVVDVSVRVVADAAFAEPDRLANPERIAKDALVAVARETGIPLLNRREQALLGHEQRAFAVGLDRAAFEDDALAVVRTRGLDAREAR